MAKQVIKGEDGKEYVMSERKPLTRKPWFWTIIIIIVILLAGGLGTIAYQKHKAAEEAAALKAKEDRFNDEEKNFSDYSYKVGNKLRSMDNKISKLWYGAIYNDNGVTVDGKNYTDFNKAISAQFDVWNENGDTDTLNSNAKYLASNYKRMETNVTSSSRESFAKDKKIYNDIKSYYTLVTSPSGTYATYSSNTTNANNKLSTDLQ